MIFHLVLIIKLHCGSPSCFINPKDWIPYPLEYAKCISSYLLEFHGQEAQVYDVKNITYNGINDFIRPCGSLKCSIPCCLNVGANKALTSG